MHSDGERLFEDAIAIIAERQLRGRQAAGGEPIGNPGAWLAKASDSIRHQHLNEVEHLDLSRYNPDSLAHRLENGVQRAPSKPGWHSTKGDDRCKACDGNGWVEAPKVGIYEYVDRCPWCGPRLEAQ